MAADKVLVLVGGGYHDFPRCGEILKTFLASHGFDVTLTEDFASITRENLSQFQALVIYTQGDGLNKTQVRGLTGWVRAGGALVGIHCASDSFKTHKPYLNLLGSMFIDHGPVHEFKVEHTAIDHYITRRMTPFSIVDELYLLESDPEQYTTLADAYWQGQRVPMVYTREEGDGRIVYLALGHDERAFNHPDFQKLVVRSIRWGQGAKEAKPVRCGVIGYGGAFNMGKVHADAIIATHGLHFVAACDQDPARAEAAQQDFGQIETFTDPGKMLKKKDLDLVILITPHDSHGSLGVKAAKAGKHVVTEKPMCLTAREATQMLDAAENAGTMMSVFHNRRWDGDYVALRQIICSGMIGEVFQIECAFGGYGHPGEWWRSDRKVSGGAMYDWGAHFVDWILNLVPGRVVNVTGFAQKRVWHSVTNEDHTVAHLRFENGATASLEQSNIAALPRDRWRILGTKGAVRMHDYPDGAWTVTSHAGPQPWTGQVPFAESDWHGYYRNVADHLLMGEELAVKGHEGRRVIAVLETAAKSAVQGKSLSVPFE